MHRCHAEGCNVRVPPRLLMCKPHWFMVSPATRRRVWAEYVPGQEIGKTPTEAYLNVMRQAIEEVACKEGRRA